MPNDKLRVRSLVMASAAIGAVLALTAGIVLWVGATPTEDLPPAEPGERSGPADSVSNSATNADEFERLLSDVRSGADRSASSVMSLFEWADAYRPTSVGQPAPEGVGPARRMAIRSLGVVAREWVMRGPIPGVSEAAIDRAMRWSVDEDPTLRANCATMLMVVDEAGLGDLPASASARLAELRADPEVEMILQAQLEAWRSQAGG